MASSARFRDWCVTWLPITPQFTKPQLMPEHLHAQLTFQRLPLPAPPATCDQEQVWLLRARHLDLGRGKGS